MDKVKRKKKLGGFPATGVIFSITLALLVSGVLGLLILYSQELERQVRSNVNLQVYLRSGLTETQRLQIQSNLLDKAFVNREEQIVFVSKDEAAKELIAETGEDFIQLIGENPLHDALLVSILPSYQDNGKMKSVMKEVQQIRGVFDVAYEEGLLEDINKNIRTITVVLLGIFALLAIAIILLINNTLRLALFSQRFLIRSMQLVGATRGFIQKPFLMRSAGYAVLSAAIAGLLVWLLVRYATQRIPDLATLNNPQAFYTLLGVLTLLSVLITVVTTYFAMRKYLRMTLDELY